MGFITRAFSVLAGSEEFPSGSDNALCRQRSEVLLTKSVECIISANQGWQLDQRTPTSTSYLEIPAINNGPSIPSLLLRNTESGCKMFISYCGSNSSFSIKNFNGCSNLRSSTGSAQCGLIISIIPDSSKNEFGDPSTETFIPDDATRLVGSSYSYSYINPANNPTSGWGYEYYFGITPFCVFVYASHLDSGAIKTPFLYVPIYACGRILESVAHGETTTNALYGVISFRVYATQYEAWAYVFCQDILDITFGNTFTTIGTGTRHNNVRFSLPIDDVSRVDGSWIGNAYNDHYKIMHFAINPNILGVSQFSGNVAWSAIGVAVTVNYNAYPDEISVYGITSTDCFKGILDTNLFRAIANGKSGTLYDSGKFYCPEDNIGLLLGWDPSNLPMTAYWGDEVTIPDGYTVDYIDCNVAYSFAKYKDVADNVTIVFGGKDQYSTVLESSMIQNYPPSKYPALEIFKGASIDNSATPKMQGVRLTRGSDGAAPNFIVTNVDVNGTSSEYDDYFIYLQGTTTNEDVKNTVMSKYPIRLFLQANSAGNVGAHDFRLPTSLYRVTNNKISWLGDTSNEEDLAYYYANDWGGQILFNVYLKKV